MLDLVETYDRNPQIKKISLELKCIKDMTQMVQLLSRFRNLSQLSLHGNQLKSIPPLSSLQKLIFLDISNNPIKIDNFLLDRLFQLPRLQHLIIDSTPAEREVLIQHLPKLESINRQIINRKKIEKQSFAEQKAAMALKLQEQMQRIKEMYQKLNQMIQKSQNNEKTSIEVQYQQQKKQQEMKILFNDIQEQMAYFYQGLRDNLSCSGVFAYCKNKLTSILDGLMIKILDELGNQQTVKVYQQICKVKSQNFDNLLKIIFTTSFENHVEEEMDKPHNHIRKEKLYLNQIFRMKKQVTQARQENNKIQRLAVREVRNRDLSSSKPTSRSNHTMKQTFDNMSFKKSPSKPLLKSNSKPSGLSRTPSKVLNKSPSKVLNKSPSNVLKKLPINTNDQKQSRTDLLKPETDRKSSARTPRTPSARTPSARTLRNQPNKIQSLDQLLSLIEEIMDEKAKFNNKNFQKKQSYETTQQFLFSFFSRKYGLKEIALDWSLSLIRSIQKYCKQSIQVEIFGKILKNNLYQNYYDQCRQFDNDIQSAFKREKIGQQLNSKQFSTIFINFFSYQNSTTIKQILQSTQFPLKREQMVHFLQSYKLAFEQKYLKPFRQMFEQFDSQGNSYLTQNQCRIMCNQLAKVKGVEGQNKSRFVKSVEAMLGYCKKDKYIFSEVFQMMHSIL